MSGEKHWDGVMCQAESRDECNNDAHWTPEPSEVAETTAGEREALADLIWNNTDEPMWSAMVLAEQFMRSPWLAAHVSAAETKARADERERIAADALELVREWTATDGRGNPALMVHGRDLDDFRDQLADVIAGRAS